jgi:hypothetical protein
MTTNTARIPSFRASTFWLAALSLAIGWGIRGNFGHEYGAMLPGALTAIAVCLLSGREDWRERVAFFGCFGALGWGFGGSISYMQVIGYTLSGHWPSQYYGFFGLFCIGFLWASMGGAGTALPAVLDRNKLTELFKPMLFIFATWFAMGLMVGPLSRLLMVWTQLYETTENGQHLLTLDRTLETTGIFIAMVLYNLFSPILCWFMERPSFAGIEVLHEAAWHRHESPFWWFDADWMQAFFALIGVCLFDLVNRKGERAWVLAILAGGSAVSGYLVYKVLAIAGLASRIGSALTRKLGDPESLVAPKSGDAYLPDPENYLKNWPQFFEDLPFLIGPLLGCIIGAIVYFSIWGKFRCGSSLFLHMAAGWLICFLIFPTLLGIRMTPPRSDDWAGITGVFLGTTIWAVRSGHTPVALASVVCGFIGGIGFSGIQMLRLGLMRLGNGYAADTPEQDALHAAGPETIYAAEGAVHNTARTIQESSAFWQHWQSANWHSWLEQSYGFANGIAVAVALGILATRVKPLKNGDGPRRVWTEAFAAFFVLIGVTYFNLFKNVREWTKPEEKMVPENMKMPLVEFIEMSAASWFNITYLLFAIALIWLMRTHVKRGIAIVPATALGKGQLIYLVLLWAMVIGNLERALAAFHEQRIITEWVIMVNAVIVTLLILCTPRRDDHVPLVDAAPFKNLLGRAVLVTVIAMPIIVTVEFGVTRMLYDDNFVGHGGYGTRFGSQASWRIKPNIKADEGR